jgi:hypothetical protein
MMIPFRPRLETLEDRRVPATFTVTKLTDGVGVPGLTLREAVELANANDNAAVDKIVFKTELEALRPSCAYNSRTCASKRTTRRRSSRAP